MDRSSNEEKKTCLCPKRLKTCEGKNDFISDLPDPILVHILSSLPLRDAIRTVLLPRFGDLWLSLPVLDLDNCIYHESEDDDDDEICNYEKLMDIIHQVWNHPDNSTLDKLHLNFWFPLTYSKIESSFDHPDFGDFERREVEKERAAAYQIEKLVGYAISRKVKVLDLNFKGCGFLEQFYELPDVFRSTNLTDLRLSACDIRSCGKINLPALRILSLNEVYLSDEAMERILLGCPFLEHLSVVDCYGLGKLNSENPNLKKLMLSLETGSKHLFLSCPHVVSLEISGWIERATLLHASSLHDASICFSYLFKCEQRAYVDVWWLMLKVHQCKTFSLCCWSILVMSIWMLKNIPCPRFKWKHITLQFGLTKWHLPGLCFLLKHASSLETLTMRTFYLKDSFFQREAAKWIWEYDFDGEKYWDSQEATFPCLESIMIYGRHINKPYFIQMVKFLLKNAPKLQKIVISTKKRFTSEQLLELSGELLTFPRASSEAILYFS